ncbi:MAG: carbamoyl-phosphate synthase subunit L [Deltaproteobacteria bacterium]|nr:carbamoyl-phosphate synthase subunit L [Deltaproteobacteria bacterium]
MSKAFKRIAILNRGEAAMRLIAAVREWNESTGDGLRTIALFTESDRRSLFVRTADDALSVGPTTIASTGGESQALRFDLGRVKEALVKSRADAVWAGWGPAAEDAALVEMCEAMGIVFVGPNASTIKALSDRVLAHRAAARADIPTGAWSEGPVETYEEAVQQAERIGFPLVLKPLAGHDTRAPHRVDRIGQLKDAFERARQEAEHLLGRTTLVMERVVLEARHIEVQVAVDDDGTIWGLGARDATLQHRGHKVLEETPPPGLTDAQLKHLDAMAAKFAASTEYRGLGTITFQYDPRTKAFTFLEVTPRLQMSHPTTEVTTGLDLVKLQLHLARGGKLEGEAPKLAGHAVAVRVKAEDPELSFAPARGIVDRLRLAAGPGIRIDAGVAEGDALPSPFDPTIATVVGHASTRDEALGRLGRSLSESTIVIRGGTTNKSFLLGLVRAPDVRANKVDTAWLDARIHGGKHLSRSYAEVALIAAAIEGYEAELDIERSHFYATASRGRPDVGEDIGRRIQLTTLGISYSPFVSRMDVDAYRIDIDGHRIDAIVERFGDIERRLVIGEADYRIQAIEQGLCYLIEVEGVAHRIARDEGGFVRSPAPAVVVNVLVKPGDVIAVGDPLVVLEAMKMEMAVEAKFPGRVRDVEVITGVQVQTGAPLILVEPTEERTLTTQDIVRLEFQALAHRGKEAWSACEHNLSVLRSLVLGYDAQSADLKAFVAPEDRVCEHVRDPRVFAIEDEILALFVDICALVRRRFDDADEPVFGRHSAEEHLFTFLRDPKAASERLPEAFIAKLKRCVAHYGVDTLDPMPALEECLFRIYKSNERVEEQVAPILSLLQARLDALAEGSTSAADEFRVLLDRLIHETRGRFPGVNDLAHELRYLLFEKPIQDELTQRAYQEAETTLQKLVDQPKATNRAALVKTLVDCPQPLKRFFSTRIPGAASELRRTMLEALVKRYYRIRDLEKFEVVERSGVEIALTEYVHEGGRIRVAAALVLSSQLSEIFDVIAPVAGECPRDIDFAIDIYAFCPDELKSADEVSAEIVAHLNRTKFPRPIRRALVALTGPARPGAARNEYHFTARQSDDGFVEDRLFRGWHLLLGRRLNLWRLSTNFSIERVPTEDSVHLFHAVARTNAKDERLVAFAEVRDLIPVRDERGQLLRIPSLEGRFHEALAGIRRFQSQRPARKRLHWNRIHLFVWPTIELSTEELNAEIYRLARETEGLGIERTLIQGRFRDAATGNVEERLLDVSSPTTGKGLSIRFRETPKHPMQPLSEYTQKVVELRQRGLIYPYELISMLTPAQNDVGSNFPPGSFQEYDLAADGRLEPVDRPPGGNSANLVVGLLTSRTAKYPEGMTRVAIFGDPSHGLGSLAEPECARIMGALDLAEKRRLPAEWYAVSAGAKISMESGTENMDWISAVLRRIITFTQAGCELNILVCGVTVGAQPYWNAEATMLMHTRGILVMTGDSSMVLTGKRALDYSGGVSAEDNEGIGGFERIMGPNGQAQYFARDVPEACDILLRHYDHTYIVPGEPFPRRAKTSDPVDRDPGLEPHGQHFATVGEIFSEKTNPGRKKPFDIRKVMLATVDKDHAPLERWGSMKDAETSVVWDAHIGGYPVCLLGIESQPVPRRGIIPADGPAAWTSGTLFPRSSKKVARAVNSASGNRPLVVLANLSGFDGSPESMRDLQLEYGAEIGRAVVNFRGPIVFTVVSRYHGGAFVVFSAKLNDHMEIAALEGTHASVIGGAPAAAVVFAGQVAKRTGQDPRVLALQAELKQAERGQRVVLRDRLNQLQKVVYAEKLREIADEFDTIHSVERARKVGSVHEIIKATRLRSYVIEALERGIGRWLATS